MELLYNNINEVTMLYFYNGDLRTTVTESSLQAIWQSGVYDAHDMTNYGRDKMSSDQ